MGQSKNILIQNIKKVLVSLNKVKGKLSWSLSGNILFALSQWGIITILARMNIDTDLGDYSLALAITAPIILFFNFDLRTLLATDSKNDYKFNEYFGSRIAHMIFAFLLLTLFIFIYTDDTTLIQISLLIGLIKFIESLSDITFGYFQKNGEINLIGKSQLYRGIYGVLVFSITYYISEDLKLSVIAILLVMILRLFFYDLYNLRKKIKIKPVINITSLNLIKLAYPLGFTALIGSLLTNLPRYFLDYYAGVVSVGVFSALYYILVASNMVMTPLSLLAGPHLANSYHENKKKFIRNVIKLIMLSIIFFLTMYIPILFFSETILGFFYGKEFIQYALEFKVLSSSMLFAFINAFLNLSLVSMRALRSQAIVNFLVLIITVLSSIAFISSNLILGAAVVMVISRATQTLFLAFIFIYYTKKRLT